MKLRLVVGLLLGAGIVLIAPRNVMAHGLEKSGERTLELGWANEPAFVGQINAIELTVRNADGSGVEGLAQTLNVTVSFGDSASEPLRFEPTITQPGRYHAAIVPTQPGSYSFHVSGKIEESDVDITKASGEGSFDAVRNPTELQFPLKVPSQADIAARVDRVDARATAGAKRAESQAKVALVLAIVLSMLGLVVRRRR